MRRAIRQARRHLQSLVNPSIYYLILMTKIAVVELSALPELPAVHTPPPPQQLERETRNECSADHASDDNQRPRNRFDEPYRNVDRGRAKQHSEAEANQPVEHLSSPSPIGVGDGCLLRCLLAQ